MVYIFEFYFLIFFKKISIGKFEYPKIWFCNFLQVEISMVLQNLLILINTAQKTKKDQNRSAGSVYFNQFSVDGT